MADEFAEESLPNTLAHLFSIRASSIQITLQAGFHRGRSASLEKVKTRSTLLAVRSKLFRRRNGINTMSAIRLFPSTKDGARFAAAMSPGAQPEPLQVRMAPLSDQRRQEG
jgi:hypothetical protein